MKLAWFVVLALLPSSALAEQRKRLAILPSIVRAGPSAVTSSQVIEAMTKALELRPSLDLVTSSEILTGTAEPVLSTAERCGADLVCIRERVGSNRIDLALRVVVNHAVEPALISLHLVDVASATIVRESFGEEQADMRADLALLARQLFDQAGHLEGARIRLAVSPPDAEVTFPNALRLGADLFLVEPGKHQIDARHDGYSPSTQLVTAARGADLQVSLALIPEAESIVASPWLWVGVGAGVAVIGVVVTLVVVDPHRPSCICVTTKGAPPCDC